MKDFIFVDDTLENPGVSRKINIWKIGKFIFHSIQHSAHLTWKLDHFWGRRITIVHTYSHSTLITNHFLSILYCRPFNVDSLLSNLIGDYLLSTLIFDYLLSTLYCPLLLSNLYFRLLLSNFIWTIIFDSLMIILIVHSYCRLLHCRLLFKNVITQNFRMRANN